VIDLDPQHGTLSLLFDLLDASIQSSALFDGINNDLPIDLGNNLYCTPCNDASFGLEQQHPDRVLAIKYFASNIRNTGYDWIILDCPPSQNLATIAAQMIADVIILPMTCQVLSLGGLNSLIKFLDAKQISAPRFILPSRVQIRRNEDLEVLAMFQDKFPQNCLDYIPESVTISNIGKEKIPAWEIDKKAPSALALKKLIKDVSSWQPELNLALTS